MLRNQNIQSLFHELPLCLFNVRNNSSAVLLFSQVQFTQNVTDAYFPWLISHFSPLPADCVTNHTSHPLHTICLQCFVIVREEAGYNTPTLALRGLEVDEKCLGM
jgi:hypothetical protein